VGGGLSGLINAIILNRAGFSVTVFERKSYPFHRVCGEYISNEVLPFFNSLDIHVKDLGASAITRLEVTSVAGSRFSQQLPLGGFGISRFTLDHHLYQKAKSEGVTFHLNTKVEDVICKGEGFEVNANGAIYASKLVIGSFGKRSNLDQKLNRPFFNRRSPYVGVKYHFKGDFPPDLIQLNNFKNGYAGIVSVENGVLCLCYLVHRDELKKYHSIQALEKQSMSKNPFLKQVFDTGEFLWAKPEVINEISFEKKQLIDNHILMTGDTAGMIAPLCGNGMSMAIHSAKLLSETITNFYNPSNFTNANRLLLEEDYKKKWSNLFSTRLIVGRQLQKVFGNNLTTNIAINTLKMFPAVTEYLISKTHGKPFK
jgi:flavin-dependent dehydrogenase